MIPSSADCLGSALSGSQEGDFQYTGKEANPTQNGSLSVLLQFGQEAQSLDREELEARIVGLHSQALE